MGRTASRFPEEPVIFWQHRYLIAFMPLFRVNSGMSDTGLHQAAN